MKRGAERQLTKDTDDDGEDASESGPGKGFQKADERILAGRPMRGLPKRAVAAITPSPIIPSASVTPEPDPPSAPAKFAGFGGFSGFSGASTGSSLFTPSAPKPAAPTPAPVSSTSAFSSSPSVFPSLPSSFSPPSTSPAVAPSASNATKLFASFISSATPAAEKVPETKAPQPKLPNGTHTGSEDDRVKVETKYYSALRGLNADFLSALTKAVEFDPFVDASELLEKYKSFRQTAKAEFDDGIKKLSSVTTSSSSSKISAPKPPAAPTTFGSFGSSAPSNSDSTTSSATTSKPQGGFAMPAPPGGFAGFSNLNTATSTSSTSLGGGFKPQFESSPPKAENKIPFSFGDKPATSTAENGTSSTTVKSAFSFNAPATSSFSFGNKPTSSSSSTTTGSSPFGAGASPSVFSSNLFGGSSEDKKEKEDEKSKETSTGTSGATNFFGSSSPFGQPSTDKGSGSPGFVFGSSSPTKTSLFGGLTKPGSLGNPVGFGFGSPPKTPDAAAPYPFSQPAGFSLAAPSKPEVTEDAGSEAASSGQATPDEPAPLLANSSPHDLDGEGEEDEETAYEVRSKVYRMAKKEDGTQEWKDMGIGILKLKVHKESEGRRLLLRNSGTGKIIINFNVHSGMAPSIQKNIVSFMGHENGTNLPYKIRVKTEEQAAELKKTLDDEVEAVKAKSG